MPTVCATAIEEPEPTSELDRSTPVLGAEDARQLAIYFGCMQHRAWFSMFKSTPSTGVDRSSYGAFMHRLEHSAGGSKRCRECKGHGWVASKQHQRKLAKQTQIAAKGTDEQRERLALLLVRLWEQRAKMPAFDRMCMKCRGTGVVERTTGQKARGPITARPTGSSVQPFRPHSSMVEGDWLIVLSRMHRKVVALARADLWALHVFDCYFDAHNVTQHAKRRDLKPLWRLTPAGKTLLRSNSLGIPAVDYFQNLTQSDLARRDRRLQKLFAACDEQAGKMFDQAVAAWVRLHG